MSNDELLKHQQALMNKPKTDIKFKRIQIPLIRSKYHYVPFQEPTISQESIDKLMEKLNAK